MLKNIYTTSMSPNKKKLQNRFSKIRAQSGRLSKIISLVLAVLIAVTFLCATVVMAMFDGRQRQHREITVFYNETPLIFENHPFFQNRTVYLPMTELFEKIGVAEKIKITYDGGKIHMEIEGHQNHYDIAILKNSITYSYFYPGSNHQVSETITPYAPLLVDDMVYIPFDYIDWILNRYNDMYDISFVFADINSKVPYKENAEFMTYSTICDLQFQVDNGHFPWRLVPSLVISSFMEGIGEGGGTVTELFGDGICLRATYTTPNDAYSIELFKPVQTDEQGIWIVKEYHHKEPKIHAYTPDEIKDIKRIALLVDGVEYPLMEENAIKEIEKALAHAKKIEMGGTACPFDAKLLLTKNNGEQGFVTIATDSCAVYKSTDVYYDYGDGDNAKLLGYFGWDAEALVEMLYH